MRCKSRWLQGICRLNTSSIIPWYSLVNEKSPVGTRARHGGPGGPAILRKQLDIGVPPPSHRRRVRSLRCCGTMWRRCRAAAHDPSGRAGRYCVAPCCTRRRTISFCCAFASGEPLPPRPVVRVASSIGVEPFLFLRRGSAPPLRRAFTAAAQHVRTARCKGVTPLLSTVFGSAPASMRHSTVAACARGFHVREPGIPTTAA
jgi:hypothetical protein